jgi:hypothetical protein
MRHVSAALRRATFASRCVALSAWATASAMSSVMAMRSTASAERVEDVVLTDVDLAFATVDVRAPAVCASIVAVLARVLAGALHLRRERDLAAALGRGAPERERTLVEEALVLQFLVGALLAERRL